MREQCTLAMHLAVLPSIATDGRTDGLTESSGHRAEESSPFVTRTRAYGFIVAVVTAQDEWRRLTKPQRAALVNPKGANPAVLDRLRAHYLIRKDGKRTVWGDQVLRFTNLMRGAS